MGDGSPKAFPGIAFLRGLVLAVAAAFAFGTIALFLPGEVTSTSAEVAILLTATVLLLSPVPLFLGLTWRHGTLPRALRGVVSRIAVLYLVIAAVCASVVPADAVFRSLAAAFALVGVVALIRLFGRAHQWTENVDRGNPYVRLVGVGAVAVLLFATHVVFEKSGHLTPKQVAGYALRSDLDRAIEYQRVFYADSGRYAAALGPSTLGPPASVVITLTPDGYVARARDEVGGTECVVEVLRSPAVTAGVLVGYPECVYGDRYPKRRSPDLFIYLAGIAIALFGWWRAARVKEEDASAAPEAIRTADESR